MSECTPTETFLIGLLIFSIGVAFFSGIIYALMTFGAGLMGLGVVIGLIRYLEEEEEE